MDPVEEWWEERAAIMEFDGGMARGDAQYAAYALALRLCERTGASMPYAGYFYVHRLSEGARLEWSDETSSVEYTSPPRDWRRW
jgi:hypothetical protein